MSALAIKSQQPVVDRDALRLALQEAVATLVPALEILERFHHRNKNQHRLSKWWAQADMLRRHLRKLLVAMDARAEELERPAQKVKKTKKASSGEKEEELNARAAYMQFELAPRAYLAFTQLAADRQFAHLGLMLLGILAQVNQAVSPFAPTPPEEQEDDDEEEGQEQSTIIGQKRQQLRDPSIPAAQTNSGHQRTDNIGIPVSRDAIMATMSAATASTITTTTTTTDDDDDVRVVDRTKSKSKSKLSSSSSSRTSKTKTTKTITAATEMDMGIDIDIKTSIEPEEEEEDLDNGVAILRRKRSSSSISKRSRIDTKVEKRTKAEQPDEDDDDDDDDGIFGPPQSTKKSKRTIFLPPASSPPPPPSKKKKVLKKKKKKKGGDEFDDIFNSLF
ncbi:hypothetical protein B0T17DRAFT_615593 [Bombardia bombarda]|uniref:RNase MRP protein 1 RNA binding domain-containing protein n=1 Tax=Bombardia bombarda TaxID=252184 RepID=A0AA39X9L3_9PEZI|nr:hypothetical protein B0T17DRAFT_615593 [Bombardia bombarda]